MTSMAPQDAGWDPKVPSTYELKSNELDEENVHAPQWYANAVKYEWNEDYGDGVGPRIEELEQELFHDLTKTNEGEWLANLKEYEITVEGSIQINPVKRFEDAGLHPVMLETIKLCNYSKTMPVQAYCIPAILSGKDVMAVAQTGKSVSSIPPHHKLTFLLKVPARPRPTSSRCCPSLWEKPRSLPPRDQIRLVTIRLLTGLEPNLLSSSSVLHVSWRFKSSTRLAVCAIVQCFVPLSSMAEVHAVSSWRTCSAAAMS